MLNCWCITWPVGVKRLTSSVLCAWHAVRTSYFSVCLLWQYLVKNTGKLNMSLFKSLICIGRNWGAAEAEWNWESLWTVYFWFVRGQTISAAAIRTPVLCTLSRLQLPVNNRNYKAAVLSLPFICTHFLLCTILPYSSSSFTVKVKIQKGGQQLTIKPTVTFENAYLLKFL
jgi:hypothetical protein